VTSAGTNVAVPPPATILPTTSAPRLASRPEATTLAPSSASRAAVAAPIPEVPPVTTMTLLSSLFMTLTLSRPIGPLSGTTLVPRWLHDA
jgi:hypothetical protein